jgi:hypothetical protein
MSTKVLAIEVEHAPYISTRQSLVVSGLNPCINIMVNGIGV